MDFKKLSTKEAYKSYKKLYNRVKYSYSSFNNLDFFNLRLFKGDFLLLKRRFDLEVYGLFDKEEPLILLTHYKAKSPELGVAHSLGAILIDNNVPKEDIAFFSAELKETLKVINEEIIAPLNGHFNLGFCSPSLDIDPSKVSFLTSAPNDKTGTFLNDELFFEKERTFSALNYQVDTSGKTLKKIQKGLAKKPKEFGSRKISLINYKNDIRKYNDLYNKCFKGHYNFFPLTFEEEWDLMKSALTIINRDYFRFLTHNGKEIGFSWFLPDYNVIFENGNDPKNMIKLLSYKSRPTRVRGLNSGILPEYRGQGLLKYARNENLLKIISDGVKDIESSYIDEANINSIENVKSTGAILSHEFYLYKLNKQEHQSLR